MVNCDECKERVLELIEREAVDPEGVREILDACPDCRAELERVKAQLAMAAQLPLEAPPDALDVAILQAAEARASGAAAVMPSPAAPSFFGQPWAMAAVALLVVGAGLATVSLVGPQPQADLQFAEAPSREAPAVAPSAADEIAWVTDDRALEEGMAEVAQAGGDSARAGGTAADPLGRSETALPQEPAPARRAMRAKAKKEAGSASAPPPPKAADEHAGRLAAVAAEADAPAARSSTSYAAGAMADVDAEIEAEPVPEAKDAAENEPDCAAQIRAFEARRKGAGDAGPTPEEALQAGLCYQKLDRSRKARRWLEEAREHPSTRARAAQALESLE